ncbi:MAG: putative aminohydrolase SsnA [Chloroflexota bacterium]
MLITHANLITWERPNRILADYAVRIDGSLIAELGPSAALQAAWPAEDAIDAGGQYVMPGNLCAHTHFYGAFARGMAVPGEPPARFPEILARLWWPLDRALTLEDVRYSALICLVDAIKHGTTTLFDHHASPNAIDGSLDVIASAVQQAGLRAVLCYEVTDRNGPAGARQGIAENVRFLRREASGDLPPQIRAAFGLHAPLTVSTATLEACLEAAPQGAGFHLHVSESGDDRQALAARGDGLPVDWLYRYGALGPKTIAAHCVHVDDSEMAQLAETGSRVTHQPRSNMNNAVGVSPAEAMLAAGVRVCLGNDGFSNAMWEEWKAAYLLHKSAHTDPRCMNGNTVVEMAVYHNAALASAYFPYAPVGAIRPGAAADLIFVAYHPFTPLSVANLPWHILFGFHESMVTTTLVAGKVLMRERQLLTLDEAEIAAKARQLSQQAWKRYGEEYA